MHTRRTNIRKNEATPSTETAPAAAATTEATPPASAATTETTPAGTAPASTENEAQNPPSMDELAARVAEAEKGLEATTKTFTPAEFATYVNDQLEKAKGEDATKAAARYKALQAAIGLAKTAFESTGSATIPVYHDPWQTDPTTKGIASPTGVTSGTSNVGYPTNVDTAKRAAAIAKQLREDAAFAAEFESAVVLSKSDAAVPVAKAGEAAATLDKIATMFGVELDDGPNPYCELRWKVGDVISSIQDAFKMDLAMQRMASLLGNGAPAPATAAPTDTTAAAKSVTKSASDDFSITVGAITNADGWPVDMNSSPRISKAAKPADEEITF